MSLIIPNHEVVLLKIDTDMIKAMTYICLTRPGVNLFVACRDSDSRSGFIRTFRWVLHNHPAVHSYSLTGHFIRFESTKSKIQFLDCNVYQSDPYFDRLSGVEYHSGYMEPGLNLKAIWVLERRIGRQARWFNEIGKLFKIQP